MKMSLRVRLLGTIIGAIVLFFIISVVAARLVLSKDLRAQGETEVTNGAGAFGGYWDSRKDQIKLLVAQDAVQDALRKNLQAGNSCGAAGSAFEYRAHLGSFVPDRRRCERQRRRASQRSAKGFAQRQLSDFARAHR